MTACDSRLGSLQWKIESSASAWGEDLSTWDYRLDVIEPPDLSGLQQPKIDPMRMVQLMHEGSEHIIGTMGGSFKFKMNLAGHGSTTSGATAMRSLFTLLGWMIGSSQVSASAGDTITGGTASIPTTTGASGFDAHSLCRIGTLGDGHGNGQFAAVSTHSSNSLNLLTAIDGSPANLDVLYSAELAYVAASTCAIIGSRFLAQTADVQMELHGCFPQAIAITGLDTGVPQAEFTVGVSWFKPVAATFPTTATYDSGGPYNPAASAAGSCFFQTHGTATRALLVDQSFALDLGLNVVPIPSSSGGVVANQYIVGARRLAAPIMIRIVVDAGGASTSPTYYTAWETGGKKHLLKTCNPGIGTALGIYAQCMRFVGARPIQTSKDGHNAVELMFACYANETVTTDELTESPLIIAGA